MENQLPRGLSVMLPNLLPSLRLALTAQMADKAQRKPWEGRAEGWRRRTKESQHFDTRHTSHPPQRKWLTTVERQGFGDEMDYSGPNPFIVKGRDMMQSVELTVTQHTKTELWRPSSACSQESGASLAVQGSACAFCTQG